MSGPSAGGDAGGDARVVPAGHDLLFQLQLHADLRRVVPVHGEPLDLVEEVLVGIAPGLPQLRDFGVETAQHGHLLRLRKAQEPTRVQAGEAGEKALALLRRVPFGDDQVDELVHLRRARARRGGRRDDQLGDRRDQFALATVEDAEWSLGRASVQLAPEREYVVRRPPPQHGARDRSTQGAEQISSIHGPLKQRRSQRSATHGESASRALTADSVAVCLCTILHKLTRSGDMGPLVVLAYSAWLDTSAIVPWLRER